MKNQDDNDRMSLHEDVPWFREAIAFTAAKTGFNSQVVEKDYFCSVLLEDLARYGGRDLLFKGGTCLAKVHSGFYRLSEDLDFTVPIPVNASRAERSHAAGAMKHAVAAVSDRLPCFWCKKELRGANDSTHYSGTVGYQSVVSGEQGTVLIDVSVREPVSTDPAMLPARTILLDPISGQSAVPELTIACITALEAMAEKFRAALTRRDVAIRDFYDLDYAARHLSMDFASPSLIAMVREKLAIPGNPPVDVGGERMSRLRRQVEPKLKTVLREKDFGDFVLDRAIGLVTEMASRIA